MPTSSLPQSAGRLMFEIAPPQGLDQAHPFGGLVFKSIGHDCLRNREITWPAFEQFVEADQSAKQQLERTHFVPALCYQPALRATTQRGEGHLQRITSTNAFQATLDPRRDLRSFLCIAVPLP